MLFSTRNGTVCCHMDHCLTLIFVWRDVWMKSLDCKIHMLKTVAEWCYLHLVHWKNVLTYPVSHISHTNFTEWLTLHCCGNKEERHWSKTVSLHKNDIQTVASGVSKLDYMGVIFIDPRVLNEWNQLMWQALVKSCCLLFVRSLVSSSLNTIFSQN